MPGHVQETNYKVYVRRFLRQLPLKILVDNQISNPSRKLMEKAMIKSDGEVWALKYRTESHMISLLEPNFSLLSSTVDKYDMYNIITAERK